MLLHPFANQQEKYQPREGVEVARSAARQHLERAHAEQRNQAQADGKIEVDVALPQALPRRAEEGAGAEQQHRHGQRQTQIPKKPPELALQIFYKREVFGQGQQHHIAEGEGGQAQLVVEQPAGVVRLRAQLGQRNLRLVAHRGQQLHHGFQAGIGQAVADGDFLPQKLHPRLHDARVEPGQVFEQPDAGRAVHLRNVQGEPCPLRRAKRQQLRLHGFRIEVIEAAGQLHVLHFQAGLLAEAVIGAEVVGIEQLVHGAAAGAAKRPFGQKQRLGRARVAAVGAGQVGSGLFENGRHDGGTMGTATKLRAEGGEKDDEYQA